MEGYNINSYNQDGHTLLFEAVCENKLEVVRELLNSKKIQINLGNYEDGLIPLYGACLKGHVQMVRLLLENGTNANAISTIKNSIRDNCYRPIYCAIKGNHLDIFRKLIDLETFEINCIISSRGGNTSLHLEVI